jgi:hypothetical protein
VDHGEALVALDLGPGVIWASADGDQEVRRRSGGQWRSGQGKLRGKMMCNNQGMYKGG